MKEEIDSSIYGYVLPYMVKPHKQSFDKVESPFLLCLCNNQVATIFMFISDYSVKNILLICLVSTATKKLHAITAVRKLQRGSLYDTKQVVQLEQILALYVLTLQKPLRLT